ncbi:MAG: TetR/AcrR family transcriptional regulator [Nitrospinae bacterium]|nr:TetR/AcrR family transcriptional regulator [Nitrospinota bacterium]
MPKYEMDEVLTKIMRQFWRHGYSATSILDLEKATGLFRGSLYHAFGDKREMFYRALRHYDRLHRAEPIAELEKEDSPRGAVLAVFGAAASVALEGGSREGCFEVNVALELGAHDEEVASLVADAFAGMAKFFCASIERGQACGEISPEVDPEQTAKSLLGLFLGLSVLSCVSPDESFLESVVGQAEALLPSPARVSV